MASVKKEHKKYGKMAVLSMIIDDFLEKEATTQGDFWKNIKSLKENDKLTKEEYDWLSSWRKKRDKLNHDAELIPFDKNKEFKDFLREAKNFCKNNEIAIPEYSDEKYEAIGWFLYASADMEQYLDRKCKKKNIITKNKSGEKMSFREKIEKLVEKTKKKKIRTAMQSCWSCGTRETRSSIIKSFVIRYQYKS